MEQLAVATESVRVALYLDPFRFDQVDYFPAGLSITEILDSYKLPHDKLQWRILINDQVVAKESWDAARTVDGDIVIIRLMQEFFIGPALLAMMAAMSSAIGAIGSSITAFAATGLGQGIMGILGSQLIGIVGKLI